jgi:hypothetical protein
VTPSFNPIETIRMTGILQKKSHELPKTMHPKRASTFPKTFMISVGSLMLVRV